MITRPRFVLGSLALLYVAQGVPFGLAVEYLPVLLAQAHFTRTQIAWVAWLQFPWQLKVLWAHLPDRPAYRRRSTTILLGLQLALAATLALYAPFDLRSAAAVWFALTVVAAFFASAQDVFVDALAVRTLRAEQRGAGNVAQVAGYRVGILAGGAGLLLFSDRLGAGRTVLIAAGIVTLCGVGAFIATRSASGMRNHDANDASRAPALASGMTLLATFRHILAPTHVRVAIVALTYKLAPHLAGPLIKPMLVHAHWSSQRIGVVAVTVGTIAALTGAAAGGWLHRVLGEARALWAGAVLQIASCAPLVVVSLLRPDRIGAAIAIACEHFASGLGNTVLFAALMTATRRSSAGVHYTVLMALSTIGIGVGGLLSGVIADRVSEPLAYALATVAGLVSLPFLRRWDESARASADE